MTPQEWAAKHTGPFEIRWLGENTWEAVISGDKIIAIDGTQDDAPRLVGQYLVCLECSDRFLIRDSEYTLDRES